MIAPLNGFGYYELSLHKKAYNIKRKKHKITNYFYLLSYSSCEKNRCITHFLSYSVLMQSLHNPPICSSNVNKSIPDVTYRQRCLNGANL
jgi:hypothetical protein